MKQVAFPSGRQVSKTRGEKNGGRDVSKKQDSDARSFSLVATALKEPA